MSKAFVERLQDLLAAEKLNIRQFSIKAGIPYMTIKGWIENGQSPSLDYAIKVADYFDCTLDYLAGRKEY